eukprot:CAMPEP_0201110744 /NCGR_PEP_ID=MMETSP0812-20130820/71859_1 /ASSEMBLY_ACC=CAM_ASM_000668 /TAXON_ID=98059 /ORGANISM="Dinobryon sp., Strain UTEXLB2267" /LENGTH=146 /DNA_ID=CAMNT_0047373369 /DNA_START=129 /DNA_END=569 /DNA_ORIENTATION=+
MLASLGLQVSRSQYTAAFIPGKSEPFGVDPKETNFKGQYERSSFPDGDMLRRKKTMPSLPVVANTVPEPLNAKSTTAELCGLHTILRMKTTRSFVSVPSANPNTLTVPSANPTATILPDGSKVVGNHRRHVAGRSNCFQAISFFLT